MRNKILGWVGVLWGGLIVLTGIPRAITGDIGAGAYAVGQVTGLLFGALLLYCRNQSSASVTR